MRTNRSHIRISQTSVRSSSYPTVFVRTFTTPTDPEVQIERKRKMIEKLQEIKGLHDENLVSYEETKFLRSVSPAPPGIPLVDDFPELKGQTIPPPESIPDAKTTAKEEMKSIFSRSPPAAPLRDVALNLALRGVDHDIKKAWTERNYAKVVEKTAKLISRSLPLTSFYLGYHITSKIKLDQPDLIDELDVIRSLSPDQMIPAEQYREIVAAFASTATKERMINLLSLIANQNSQILEMRAKKPEFGEIVEIPFQIIAPAFDGTTTRQASLLSQLYLDNFGKNATPKVLGEILQILVKSGAHDDAKELSEKILTNSPAERTAPLNASYILEDHYQLGELHKFLTLYNQVEQKDDLIFNLQQKRELFVAIEKGDFKAIPVIHDKLLTQRISLPLDFLTMLLKYTEVSKQNFQFLLKLILDDFDKTKDPVFIDRLQGELYKKRLIDELTQMGPELLNRGLSDVYNLKIRMRCAAELKNIELMESLHRDLLKRGAPDSVMLFRTLMRGYSRVMPKKMLSVMRLMRMAKIMPDAATIAYLINGLLRLADKPNLLKAIGLIKKYGIAETALLQESIARAQRLLLNVDESKRGDVPPEKHESKKEADQYAEELLQDSKKSQQVSV
eukprot:TRINITY_DN1840_c0_g1_i1.p1 TRINITY_DN1840_c0_g1~~TRINITY_DN1840_c0_g1_i1.p1  ORF type:complete len:640 (-),score=215.58 TRINITY_DN1840_c0_g1_i1:83-1939(-)